MTFDQLCKSILEEAPNITMPAVPKVSLTAPGGKQLINAPQTSVKSQYSDTEAASDSSPNAQPSKIDQQTNAYVQNSFKQIKDLQTMVSSLSDALRKSQGLPPGPKKPTFTSASINPQPPTQ
jgi:hypothetical protein